MRRRPEPRRGKRCAVCRGPMPPASLDAFCSSECCREWHGTQLPNAIPRRDTRKNKNVPTEA